MRYGRLVAVLLIVSLGATGCSWLIVSGPPEARPGLGPPGLADAKRLDCTTAKGAPGFDLGAALLFGIPGALLVPAGGALAATTDDSWNRMFGATLVFAGTTYLAISTIFALSARRGYRDVNACRRAHAERGEALGLR